MGVRLIGNKKKHSRHSNRNCAPFNLCFVCRCNRDGRRIIITGELYLSPTKSESWVVSPDIPDLPEDQPIPYIEGVGDPSRKI